MHKALSFGLFVEDLTGVLHKEIQGQAALNNLIKPPPGLYRQQREGQGTSPYNPLTYVVNTYRLLQIVT